jgi:hypothetical protein
MHCEGKVVKSIATALKTMPPLFYDHFYAPSAQWHCINLQRLRRNTLAKLQHVQMER